MYNTKLGIPFFLLLFFLFSCSDDEDTAKYKFTVNLATVYEKNNIFYFQLDNGTKLYPLTPDENINAQLASGSRVFIQYDLLGETENNENNEAYIKLISLSRVTTGNLLFLTEQNESKLGNDPLEVESIWISGNYLNFFFYIYGDTESHAVSLVYDPASGSLSSDTLQLEIRHNAYNDFEAYRKRGIISFNIDQLENRKPLPIAIRIRTYENVIKIYHRMLK